MTNTPDILQKIINTKLKEIKERSNVISLDQLKQQAEKADAVRGFTQALLDKNAKNQSAVIAEIKKASPSRRY